VFFLSYRSSSFPQTRPVVSIDRYFRRLGLREEAIAGVLEGVLDRSKNPKEQVGALQRADRVCDVWIGNSRGKQLNDGQKASVAETMNTAASNPKVDFDALKAEIRAKLT
jgi:hypothetical protein